jgi:hypothetical protein
MPDNLWPQIPNPVAEGGLLRAQAFRPLRGPPAASVRQPDLGSPPIVVGVTGFGGSGGAFIRNNGSAADQSQGLVVIHCGINPAASGTIVLNFPIAPGARYWLGCDWAALGQSSAGNVLTITWTATRALLPNERFHLAYQWAVST